MHAHLTANIFFKMFSTGLGQAGNEELRGAQTDIHNSKKLKEIHGSKLAHR